MDNLLLNKKKITLIMISHRVSSLINCDRLIKVKGGKITEDLSSIKFFGKD